MRGIERFLAAILLAGAVGGAAVLARYAGTEPAPPAFHVAASPRQHLTIPQTVVEIPLPRPSRAVVEPVAVAGRPRLSVRTPRPAQPVAPAPVTAPAAPVTAPPPPCLL